MWVASFSTPQPSQVRSRRGPGDSGGIEETAAIAVGNTTSISCSICHSVDAPVVAKYVSTVEVVMIENCLISLDFSGLGLGKLPTMTFYSLTRLIA